MAAVSSTAELEMIESTLVPTLMCQAAATGDKRLLCELLATGANVSSTDYDGRTALHLAAAEGNSSIVRMLLDADANPVAQDRWGKLHL